MLYLLWVFKDKLSWLVFITVFLIGIFGFKLVPYGGNNFSIVQTLIGTAYSLLFALIVPCLFKTLKEK
jgi:hypothetical protein